MIAMARMTRATLVAIAFAALVFGVSMLAHSAEQNDTEIVPVALDASDPDRNRLGDLLYMGGIDIPAMGQNIGGLSGLRWDAESERLLAITDDARWVWMTPTELKGRLVGLGEIEVGALLGLDGEPLTGKDNGDSESLTRSAKGGWLIGFERNHRIWRYPSLSGKPVPTKFEPLERFGELESNGGLEALLTQPDGIVACVERVATKDRPNCVSGEVPNQGSPPFGISPPKEIARLNGVPTDMDIFSHSVPGVDDKNSPPPLARGDRDGAYVLFRSYSPANGNGAAIVEFGEGERRRELATFRPPLTVDNFEGLAVRVEGKRVFLYIVSDDNFSPSQRTLLMKFEVMPEMTRISPP